MSLTALDGSRRLRNVHIFASNKDGVAKLNSNALCYDTKTLITINYCFPVVIINVERIITKAKQFMNAER